MHWFWRAAIAVGVAYGFGRGLSGFVTRPLMLRQVDTATYDPFVMWVIHVSWVVQLATAVGVYGLLTRRYYRSQPPAETCCRKCGYILRGLTEPRCPECGERI